MSMHLLYKFKKVNFLNSLFTMQLLGTRSKLMTYFCFINHFGFKSLKAWFWFKSLDSYQKLKLMYFI